jgi:hypothetical protein
LIKTARKITDLNVVNPLTFIQEDNSVWKQIAK